MFYLGAVGALLDPKTSEWATKRQLCVVTSQWLLDCFRLGQRAPEAQYPLREATVLESHKPLRALVRLGNGGFRWI